MMSTHKNQLRIIGGKWRGRKLHFPDLPELRPTPDRVRETLFNWLAPHIVGAHCLDLFAGSGALGFEALSRGARSVVMIDQSPQVMLYLRDTAQRLGVTNELEYYCATVPGAQLPIRQYRFDLVFLDPPFHQNYLAVCCQWLQDSQCLADNALIYIEAERDLVLSLPSQWSIIKQKAAGQVGYYLIKI